MNLNWTMKFNVLFSSTFKKELKRIAKKHRQILKDIHALSDELANNPTLGTDLGRNVYKIRVAISGTAKGKSGGARVITYVKVSNESVILAEIYLKSEHATIDVQAVIKRLKADNLL